MLLKKFISTFIKLTLFTVGWLIGGVLFLLALSSIGIEPDEKIADIALIIYSIIYVVSGLWALACYMDDKRWS